MKLFNDAPHRWSSAVKVYSRVLELWDGIVAHYEKNEKDSNGMAKAFPLLYRKQASMQPSTIYLCVVFLIILCFFILFL